MSKSMILLITIFGLWLVLIISGNKPTITEGNKADLSNKSVGQGVRV